MLTPRPYQQSAIEACEAFLRERDDNPAIVLPTGSGKSLVMALMLHRWLDACPQLRAMVLAHRKELVAQNAAELHGCDDSLSIGIYSAALNKRETRKSITFASIDSVAKKADAFKINVSFALDRSELAEIARANQIRYVGLVADFI